MSVSMTDGLHIPSYLLYLVHVIVVAVVHFEMTGTAGATIIKFYSSTKNYSSNIILSLSQTYK